MSLRKVSRLKYYLANLVNLALSESLEKISEISEIFNYELDLSQN